MLRRHFALLTVCFGSIISVAACGGSDDSSPSGTGGGGATDGGTGGSGGGTVDKQEPGAQPPADPGGTPGAGTDPTVIAVRKLFVGETDRQGNPDPNAWKSFGYNLDGLVEPTGVSNAATAHPATDPARVAELRRGSLNAGTSGPLGVEILQLLTDPDNGLVLDSWIDADGQPQGNAAAYVAR